MNQLYLPLLDSLNFEEVMNAVHNIFFKICAPEGLVIMVWDSDLEEFSDRLYFGQQETQLQKFSDAYAQAFKITSNIKQPLLIKLNLEAEDLPKELKPVYSFCIQQKDNLCAVILIFNPQIENEIQTIDTLAEYPLFFAISNAWEIREIKRENERLRSHYDDLEEQNANLEEKTRKLIQDVTVKDALRYSIIEREKLLYEISAAVRSSVEIKEVLQKAVDSVGKKCDLTRCLILSLSLTGDNLQIYEYHNSSDNSAKELFLTEAGQAFIKEAMSKKVLSDLGDLDLAIKYGFDKDFMRSFNYLSALLVPLIIHDKTIGAIFLQDCLKQRSWNISDLSFFGALADQLSVAVENADLHEEKKQQAVTDVLTGLSNRRHFTEIFHKEFERARRYTESLSLVMIDIDYLKQINDTSGHNTGDIAIRAVANILRHSSRAVDLAARYGGEEFCLLLPNTTLEESVLISERVRKLIHEEKCEGKLSLSVSIGIANFPLHANDPQVLFEKADQALYKAKQNGRNCVCVYK